MLRRFLTKVFCMAIFLSFLNGCELFGGGDADAGKTDGVTTPDAGQPPPGIATFKASGETATVSFASGDEQYLVVPYSVSGAFAESIDFEVKIAAGATAIDAGASDGSVNAKSFPLRIKKPKNMREKNPKLWAKWQKRLAVEHWTRSLAEQAAKLPLKPKSSAYQTMGSCELSSQCEENEVCHNKECVSSVELKAEIVGQGQTITAEVKKKNTTAAILVDGDSTVSSEDIDALLSTFETIIYPRDVGLFGNPALSTGGNVVASDRNSDGLIWLVLTEKVKQKGAVGFFVATDFTDETASNKADILYVLPPDAQTPVEKIYPIMVHEFQHLLNYASKVYKPKYNGGTGSLEDLWLDEGQAHFAEDACGFGGENVNLLDQELFPSFSETALVQTEDTLAIRAMAMLFVRYLFERKGGVIYKSDGGITDTGGASWLAQLHTSTQTGVAAITETFGDFKNAFDYWIAAISLDGRNVTDYEAYNFDPLVNDPKTSNKIGVVIRGQNTDVAGETITLKGPLEEDISIGDTDGAIPNSSAKFFLLKGQTGNVDVTVTTQASDFRFALIKIN